MPMPPTPTMTTVSPGCTCATLVAEPNPVGTAQPMIAADSNGMSGSILTTESLCTVMYGANVPSRFIGETSVDPACTRDVPSAMALPPSSSAPRSHSDRKPFKHGWQSPQAGMNARITWSPSATPVTFLPTLVTTPAPS